MITADQIKTFMNITDVNNDVIENAINDAYEYIGRKGVEDTGDTAITKALKYLTAYYLIPRISYIAGNKGVFKQVGAGESAQHLISDADVMRRQDFYLKEANLIIYDIINEREGFLPFIDI
jgi:hypothetical protein